VASSSTVPGKTGEPRGPSWPMARAAISRATRHHLLIRGHLRIQGDERDPICPLTAVEIGDRKRVTRRRLDRSSVVAGTTFGGALAPRTSLAAVL
jgi:hypothetical protein